MLIIEDLHKVGLRVPSTPHRMQSEVNMGEYQEMLAKRQRKEITRAVWKAYLRKRKREIASDVTARLKRQNQARDKATLLNKAKCQPIESPIEQRLLAAMTALGLRPICQFEASPYRLDFAFPDCLLAIEADGHGAHSTKAQRTHDAKRQRALSKSGWLVIRFTGTEIHNNAAACAREVAEFYAQSLKT